MRIGAVVYFFIIAFAANAQNKIEWAPNYRLTLYDFQSSTTKVGSGTHSFLQTGATVEFAYQMTNAEFMMTKNWNTKITAVFLRTGASIVAPDDSTAARLIAVSRFDFDLAELSARKLRKRIFDDKKAFSSPSMFQPLFEEVARERIERYTIVANETDMGLKRELLKSRHDAVLAEIEALPDFCKTCKPRKEKKK